MRSALTGLRRQGFPSPSSDRRRRYACIDALRHRRDDHRHELRQCEHHDRAARALRPLPRPAASRFIAGGERGGQSYFGFMSLLQSRLRSRPPCVQPCFRPDRNPDLGLGPARRDFVLRTAPSRARPAASFRALLVPWLPALLVGIDGTFAGTFRGDRSPWRGFRRCVVFLCVPLGLMRSAPACAHRRERAKLASLPCRGYLAAVLLARKDLHGPQQSRLDRGRTDRRYARPSRALKELGRRRLFDVVEGLPQGKSLDIAQAGPSKAMTPISRERIPMPTSRAPTW